MASNPATIGKYFIQCRLGGGGMGDVYLAQDPTLDRLVAIKLLREGVESDELRLRFGREARTIAKLAHPNIVTIYELGEQDGRPYIAMEYVAGETLAEIVRNRSALTLVRKLEMMEELCSGLASAHRAGIVHRDIKPANIVVRHDGAVKILDFGIARIAGSGMTQQGIVIGTLNYMSPEQVLGQPVDHRSDVFAVGAVFYELLSYRRAFPGALVEVMVSIPQASPAPLAAVCPDLPPELEAIVARAMQKLPASRYQDLDRMRRDIEELREHLQDTSPDTLLVPAPHAPAVPPPTPTPARRGADPQRLAERRREQVDAHLDAARQAFAEGRYEQAIDFCESAAAIDSSDPRAIELIDQCRAAQDAQQLRILLAEAREKLAKGELDEADQLLLKCSELDAQATEVVGLRQELEAAQVEEERRAERERQVAAALERARERYRARAFDAALRAASEALAFDPAHPEARKIADRAQAALDQMRREERERRAQEAVERARALFSKGDRQAALALLGSFEPGHDLVAANLAELRAEHEILERQEAEARARRERASAHIAEARVHLQAERFDQATLCLDSAEQEDAAAEGLALLRTAAADGLARQRELRSHLERARDALDQENLDAAASAVKLALAVRPGDADATDLSKQIEQRFTERRRREQAEAEARARRGRAEGLAANARNALDAGRLDEALGFVLAAEQADAGLEGLRQLRDLILERRRLARELEAALASAATHLANGRFQDARDDVAAALAIDADNENARRLDQEIQAASEAAEAERRRDEEAAGLIAAGTTALQAGRFDEAIAAVDRLLELQPNHRGGGNLRSRAVKAKAAEVERQRHEEAARLLAAATAALDARKFDEAIAAADRLLQAQPDHKNASQIRARALKARAAEVERQRHEEAARLLAAATAALDAERFDESIGTLDRLLAAQPDRRDAADLRARAVQARTDAEVRERQRDAVTRLIANAQAALERQAFDEVEPLLDQTAVIDPGRAEIGSLRQRLADARSAEERRQRERLDAQAAAAVLAAQTAFDGGNHDAALRMLERYSPPHEQVTKALEELRAELRREEARRQAEAAIAREREAAQRLAEAAQREVEAETARRQAEAQRARDAGQRGAEAPAAEQADTPAWDEPTVVMPPPAADDVTSDEETVFAPPSTIGRRVVKPQDFQATEYAGGAAVHVPARSVLSRRAIAISALVLVIAAVGLYQFIPRTPDPIPEQDTRLQTYVRAATTAHESGNGTEAVKSALAALALDNRQPEAIRILKAVRSEAANRVAAARSAAEGANATTRADYASARAKETEVERLVRPEDTATAVQLLNEAERLYRGAERAAWNPAEFYRNAQAEYAAGRVEAAIDILLAGLKEDPANQTLIGGLDKYRRDASARAFNARLAATKDRATNAPSFGRAAARERQARALNGPADTRSAVQAYRDAEALYRAARQEALAARQQSDEERRRSFEQQLASAEQLLRSGRIDEARQSVDALAKITPADPRTTDLRRRVQRAIQDRASEAAQEQRRQLETRVAAMIEQASRAPSNDAAIQLLSEALKLDPGNAEATRLLAARRAPPPDVPKDVPKDVREPEKPVLPQPQDSTAVLATIRQFAAAYGRRDVEGTSSTRTGDQRAFYANYFKDKNDLRYDVQLTGDVRVTGNSAEVAGQVSESFTDARGRRQAFNRNVLFRLLKRGNTWLIDSMPQR